MKFRKKPVIIEAVRFQCAFTNTPEQNGIEPGEVYRSSYRFDGFEIQQDSKGWFLLIPTLEGVHRADDGDWIITGLKGEKYPCKPDIFELTYEQVEAIANATT